MQEIEKQRIFFIPSPTRMTSIQITIPDGTLRQNHRAVTTNVKQYSS